MKLFKSIFFTIVLPVMAVTMIVFGCNFTSKNKMQLCDQEYALCTSARCIPKPGDPKKAICFCSVEEGQSLGTVSCKDLKPHTDENGIHTIYSTFSFKQFNEGKMAMKCPEDTPWTWCLNKTCTVDPSDPTQAICLCDVMRKGEWMTLGGDCKTATCETGYWSGATIQDNEAANEFMEKALGLEETPRKWCPVGS